MTLGERLAKLRKEKGLSQEDVADRINVTRQTVSKWELDQSLPDFDKIIPLCKLYNISSDELLTGNIEKQDEGDLSDVNSERAIEVRRKKAITVSISLLLFVLSIIWVIAIDELFDASDALLVGGFFILGILGVINLIIGFASLPKLNYKEKEKIKKSKSKEHAAIDSILCLLTLTIYLLVSFKTGAWGITWIIWIIFALVKQIIHLILGFDDGDECDE